MVPSSKMLGKIILEFMVTIILLCIRIF